MRACLRHFPGVLPRDGDNTIRARQSVFAPWATAAYGALCMLLLLQSWSHLAANPLSRLHYPDESAARLVNSDLELAVAAEAAPDRTRSARARPEVRCDICSKSGRSTISDGFESTYRCLKARFSIVTKKPSAKPVCRSDAP